MSEFSPKILPSKNRRVIVQLDEVKSNEQHKYVKLRSLSKSTDKAEIKIIDHHRLLCNFSYMPDSEMFFDCVGLKHEKFINMEMARILSDMIVSATDSCIVQISVNRDLDLVFLHRVFVHELENYLKPLDNQLRKVYLEYYDLRKHDFVNMISAINLNSTINISPEINRSKKKEKTGKEFSNLRSLFQWLNTDFVLTWSTGNGHDLFEMDIFYHDTVGDRDFKVKLSLVRVFLSKLDLNLKTNLHSFLRTFYQKKKKNGGPFLTDLLQEYFHNDEDQILVIFNIPIFRGGVNVIKEMLKMAEDTYVAMQYVKVQEGSLMELAKGKKVVSPFVEDFPAAAPPPQQQHQEQQMGEPFSKPKTLAKLDRKFSSQSAGQVSQSSPQTGHCSMHDLHTLSYWYCKIEGKFSDVVKTMEKFYSTAYEMKAAKMKSELEGLFEQYGIKSNSDVPTERAKSKLTVHLFKEYQNAIKSFRKLFTEINASKNSKFYPNLEIFLRTKNYELLREFSRFKEIQLENCHANILDAVSQLVVSLKSPVSADSFVPNESRSDINFSKGRNAPSNSINQSRTNSSVDITTGINSNDRDH